MSHMMNRVQKLEKLVSAQRKALNETEADVDVDKHLDQRLEESLKRY
jgi:hypothetical protein